jgi:hypothetical protein
VQRMVKCNVQSARGRVYSAKCKVLGSKCRVISAKFKYDQCKVQSASGKVWTVKCREQSASNQCKVQCRMMISSKCKDW